MIGGETGNLSATHVTELSNTGSSFAPYNNPNTSANLGIAGTWDLVYIVSDFENCSGVVLANIEVDTVPCCEAVLSYSENDEKMKFVAGYSPGYERTIDYGDGSPIESIYVNNHTYAANGTYTVCLYIDNGAGCSDFVCEEVEVTNVPDPPCYAQLNTTVDPNNANTYFGENYSEGVNLEFEWDFGDGSPINTDEYPTHEYDIPGTYIVCLTIIGDGNCYSNRLRYCDLLSESKRRVLLSSNSKRNSKSIGG